MSNEKTWGRKHPSTCGELSRIFRIDIRSVGATFNEINSCVFGIDMRSLGATFDKIPSCVFGIDMRSVGATFDEIPSLIFGIDMRSVGVTFDEIPSCVFGIDMRSVGATFDEILSHIFGIDMRSVGTTFVEIPFRIFGIDMRSVEATFDEILYRVFVIDTRSRINLWGRTLVNSWIVFLLTFSETSNLGGFFATPSRRWLGTRNCATTSRSKRSLTRRKAWSTLFGTAARATLALSPWCRLTSTSRASETKVFLNVGNSDHRDNRV